MIYTLTANPAVDYHMDLTEKGFIPGRINRSSGEEMFPGGKGLNVSIVLSRLGIQSIAWAFAAGKTGHLLEALAADLGCRCDFIYLPEGETRINVKLDCENETAINGSGPKISGAAFLALKQKVERLGSGDTLILSGKLQSDSGDLYEVLCAAAGKNGAALVVDTEGESLRSTFASRPFLIKPNEEELNALFGGRMAAGMEERLLLMEKCQAEGARNILLTLGAEGALLLSEQGECYRAEITSPQTVVSTVGAGDSTIAGFLAGLSRYGNDPARALRLACAAGTATAGRKHLAAGEDIAEAEQLIRVERLN